MIEQTKTCTGCHESKPADEFVRDKSRADGLHSRCKPCRSGRRAAAPASKAPSPLAGSPAYRDAGLWFIKERDEDVVVVFDLKHREESETLVWFDHKATNWVCDACGPQQAGTTASQPCIHLSTATRGLPLSVARKIAASFKPTGKAARDRVASKSKATDEKPAEKHTATMLERTAEARARVAAEHDAKHREYVGTSEVVVRQATPEDRERLRLARERKARSYETSVGFAKFRSQ